jgi:DNA-binding CsgD family transcriptional regulator/tetratricopeptide (TPR) repeat protein
MRTPPPITPSPLLERADELEAIASALDSAAEGSGRTVLLTGPPGSGKTRLLEAAAQMAARREMRPLVARGTELERPFPFGVARELLDPAVRAAADPRGLFRGAARHAAGVFDLDDGEAGDGDPLAAIHGLHWLVADLAAEGPLMLGVDDLQWADAPTQRLLAYLARRLGDLPVALIVTARTETAGDVEGALEAIEEAAEGNRMEPAPLSADAVATLLAAALEGPVAPAFARVCRDRTGGNPFLVAELVAELRDRGVQPVASAVGLVEAAAPGGVARAVRRRLARLGPDATRLARALAVLGDDTDLALAAELAGLGRASAASAAMELAGAAIIDDAEPLRFRHPLLRAGVEAGTPRIAHHAAHEAAARILATQGGPPRRIAAHLMAGHGGTGDGWAVDVLRGLARGSRAQGAPEQAAALLRRALDEPPAPGERAAVLRELGSAGLAALQPGADAHLQEALMATDEPSGRAVIALELAIARYFAQDHAGAVTGLVAEIDRLGDASDLREERLRLEAFLGLAGRYDLGTEGRLRGRVQRVAATLAGATPAERLVRSVAALEAPGDTAVALAEAAVLAEAAMDDDSWPYPNEGAGTVAMYLFAGRPDLAAALADRMIDDARASGSPLRHALGVGARGIVAVDVGDIAGAVTDLGAAAATVAELGAQVIAPTVGYLVLALVEAGDTRRADDLLETHGLTGELAPQMLLNPLLHARGTLRAAEGRWAEAAADLTELGRRHGRWGMTRPNPPWRSGAALALLAAGAADEAAELAAEELAIATRWGAPKPIAVAERALGLIEGGSGGIERLRSARERLGGTPWRLEHARAGVDLGGAVRRSGLRREARAILVDAMDEAHRCGAEALVARAAHELRASGARPRRRAVTGADALTPSERRVADLAAGGMTNREIAQELFVSLATVETHLTRTYRKLSIDGRPDLAGALSGG